VRAWGTTCSIFSGTVFSGRHKCNYPVGRAIKAAMAPMVRSARTNRPRPGDDCSRPGRRQRIPTDGAGSCQRTMVARSRSRGGIRRSGRSAGRVSPASQLYGYEGAERKTYMPDVSGTEEFRQLVGRAWARNWVTSEPHLDELEVSQQHATFCTNFPQLRYRCLRRRQLLRQSGSRWYIPRIRSAIGPGCLVRKSLDGSDRRPWAWALLSRAG
jgi:hypothetical protein